VNEKVVYCQVDAHLDTNPKIRKGGRDARDIFEFVLRRVAIMRTEGFVPVRYLEPWYLADQLMMSQEEAKSGLARAIEVELLRIDGSGAIAHIVGWSAEWGRTPLSNADRQQRHRDKQSESLGAVTDSNDAVTPPLRVTGSNESNVGEERRGEERKSPDQRDVALSLVLIFEIVKNYPRHALARLTGAEKDKRVAKWANHVRLMREVDGHGEDEIRTVIRWCQADSFWRGNIQSTEKLREKWDTLVAQMARNGARLPTSTKPNEQHALKFTIGGIEVER
jgi:hypothetical protein